MHVCVCVCVCYRNVLCVFWLHALEGTGSEDLISPLHYLNDSSGDGIQSNAFSSETYNVSSVPKMKSCYSGFSHLKSHPDSVMAISDPLTQYLLPMQP